MFVKADLPGLGGSHYQRIAERAKLSLSVNFDRLE